MRCFGNIFNMQLVDSMQIEPTDTEMTEQELFSSKNKIKIVRMMGVWCGSCGCYRCRAGVRGDQGPTPGACADSERDSGRNCRQGGAEEATTKTQGRHQPPTHCTYARKIEAGSENRPCCFLLKTQKALLFFLSSFFTFQS